jgi:hypothetical protein
MRNQCKDFDEQHGNPMLTRRDVLKGGAVLLATPFLAGVATTVQAARAERLRRATSGIPRRNG